MRAPRDTDEIVKEILDAYGIRGSKRSAYEQETEGQIRDWIEGLRDVQGDPAFGYWIDNERRAKRLQSWVAEGQAIFTQMPKSFRLLLFLGEWMELFDSTDHRATNRARRVLSLLQWFAQRCSIILETKAGAGGNEKVQKRRAAMAARYFTERCGISLAYSTENKPYRVTARLFYEAMSGWQDAELDLRYQCEEIARLPNWDEWRQRFRRLQVLGRGQLRMEVGDDDSPEAPYIDSAC